jgi:hypothetical protein
MAIKLGATGITFHDNTVQTTAASAGGQVKTELFTSPGTWTKPASCTQVKVTVIGGGGGCATGGLNAGGASSGGTSSFGPLVSATGGGPGPISTPSGGGSPGSGSVSSPATAFKTSVSIRPSTPSNQDNIFMTYGVLHGLVANPSGPFSASPYSTTLDKIAGARGGGAAPACGGFGGLAIAEVPVSGPVSVTVGGGGNGNATYPAPGGVGGAVVVEYVG